MPVQTEQGWTCEVCGQPNCAEDDSCIQCGLARSASAEERRAHRLAYHGPVFREDESEGGRPTVTRFKALSQAWWNEQLDPIETAWWLFMAGAVSGCVFVLFGVAVSTDQLAAGALPVAALLGGLAQMLLALRLRLYSAESAHLRRRRTLLTGVAVQTMVVAAIFALRAGP